MEMVKPARSETLRFVCDECAADITIDGGSRTMVCPYCDTPAVVQRPPATGRPNPVFVVGFVLKQKAAVDNVRDWLRGRSLFARSGIKSAQLEKTRGVYVPSYLYGAVAHTSYSADIGENYTVTVSDGKGGTRTETRTEWCSLSGRHSCYVTDSLVTASRGIPNDELDAVEPFDLRAIHRYSPAMVSGWLAEEPSLPAEVCRGHAHQEASDAVGKRLSKFMPGDRFRDLQFSTQLESEHVELSLLPLWVFSARYADDKPPVRILVNGQTGKVGGKVPLSWIKITVTALVVAALGVLAYFLATAS